MPKLVPVAETAQHLLILLLKRMTVYVIELFKRMEDHWGRLHTSLLKSSKFLGVTSAFGHYIEVYRKAEALACRGGHLTSSPYPQYDFVIPDGKVRHVDCFHEALGFKGRIRA